MVHRSPALAAAFLALAVFAAAPAPAQDLYSTPLSRGFAAPPLRGSVQAPALWYYGPSYSLYYDRPPAGATSTGPAYRPSHRTDPFYGRDFLERSERGERFGR